MSREITMKVTVGGRSMFGVVSGTCLADGKVPDAEKLGEIALLEVMGILRRLLGPTEGIRSFELGDYVVNAEGQIKTVLGIDLAECTLMLESQGGINVPIAGWRPTWTIPDAERKP